MTPMTCSEVQELAAELALDLLTGAERAAALAHLAGCAACRSEVASLTDAGEAVLALAPEVPPSAGFESRVISRISALPPAAGRRASGGGGGGAGVGGVDSADRRGRGRRWPVRRRAVLAAAAAVVAVVALAAALVVGRGGDAGDRGGDTGDVAAADILTPSGQVVGEATLRDGDPAVVTVDMGDWVEHLRRYGESAHHSYWLTVGAGGESAEAYALPVGQPGPWHVALDGDESDGAVTSVAVVDETGHTWCDARFTR
jgi:putative zinc finger protein